MCAKRSAGIEAVCGLHFGVTRSDGFQNFKERTSEREKEVKGRTREMHKYVERERVREREGKKHE